MYPENIKILVDYLKIKRQDDPEMKTSTSARKAWQYLLNWREGVPLEECERILLLAGYHKGTINAAYKRATAPEKPRVRRKARTGPGPGEIIDPELWTSRKQPTGKENKNDISV